MKIFTKKQQKETFLSKVPEVKTTYPEKVGSFNQVFNTRKNPMYDYKHISNSNKSDTNPIGD